MLGQHISMQKFSVDNALMKANSLVKQGHIDEAKNMYQSILSNYPKNLRALKALQAIMSAKNNTKSHQPAQQSIAKLINIYNQGQFIDLISEAEYLLKVNPESYVIWNIKGAAEKVLGHIDEAFESFKQVVSLNPNYPEGLNNLGTILKDQGKFDEALEVYNQALALKPDFTDCHYNRGV
jgi:tetratricopeptide (TPR) repeat protein